MTRHPRTIVQPLNGKLRCEWRECLSGMGIVGNGQCFLGGAWWAFCCPEFINEKDWIKDKSKGGGIEGEDETKYLLEK